MKKELRDSIVKAAKEAGYGHLVDFDLNLPPKNQDADYATNISLIIGHKTKENPKDVADKISKKLSENSLVQKTTVAGPGFINIVLQDHTYYDLLKNLLSEKDNFGKKDIGQGKTVSVDFVSANPTGPLHIGNARGGPIGETIANLYQHFGYKVSREFYVNDSGLQVKRLGKSFYYWHEKLSGEDAIFPEDGYPGEYVKEIVEEIIKKSKDKINQLKNEDEIIEYLSKEGLDQIIDQMKKDVELLGISFDKWIYESQLQLSGDTEKYINLLKEKNATVSREGALWLKVDADPDFKDKESVLIRSDEAKSFTYFADDIAYHMKRYEDGVEKIIDVWGANHHGHIARMNAALQVLGISKEKLQILLYQYIRIVQNGEPIKMGKRLGNFISLRQILEGGVSADAFKYFILAQNSNTPFDFDIKLAADQSERNPVYYIQYAHARICSILKKAGEETSSPENVDLSVLKNDKELSLIKELTMWPDVAEDSLEDLQIQNLPHYAYKIASLFHDFYTNCPVLDAEEETKKARLALVSATKIIISKVLSICGISAPEKM